MRNCDLIFQFFELIKTQNALHNALLPAKIAHAGLKEKKQKVQELFEFFTIWNLRYKKPAELSGGERQHVAICRALINSPKYILDDEVTASLDSETAQKTYSHLKSYIKKITV